MKNPKLTLAEAKQLVTELAQRTRQDALAEILEAVEVKND